MIQLKKEKIMLCVLYKLDDGCIGIEFSEEANNPGNKQQLVGALEMYAEMIKKELMEDIVESDDERDRWFT